VGQELAQASKNGFPSTGIPSRVTARPMVTWSKSSRLCLDLPYALGYGETMPIGSDAQNRRVSIVIMGKT
jgi:hypothetical protein